jgi:hypothetical protein
MQVDAAGHLRPEDDKLDRMFRPLIPLFAVVVAQPKVWTAYGSARYAKKVIPWLWFSFSRRHPRHGQQY